MNKKILILFCILLPIFLLLFSLKLTLSLTELTAPQQQWVDYLQGGETPIGYTDLELSHMQDVKNIFKQANILFYLSLLILTLTLTYYKKKKQIIKKLLKTGGKVAIYLYSIIILISVISFNFLFTYFHKLFFPQGNWQFPSDSLLLQTFPLEFFTTISVKIFILTILLAFITILISNKLYRKLT